MYNILANCYLEDPFLLMACCLLYYYCHIEEAEKVEWFLYTIDLENNVLKIWKIIFSKKHQLKTRVSNIYYEKTYLTIITA